MTDVIITMKDGTKREFRHQGRSGGSYTKRIAYQSAFVVVTDEWDTQTAIPAADISEVKVHNR